MNVQKLFFALSLLIAFTGFQSCQKSNTNALQEAQYCLNKASASEAKACVAGIASDVSSYASSLKCASIFISEGYGSASSLATALESMNTAGTCAGGCSPSVNALTTFKFNSAGVATPADRATNNANATEAFTVCNNSKVKSYTTISSLFKIGTLAAMAVGVANPTADEIKGVLNSLDNATVGDLVISTTATVCADTTNASTATIAYCKELTAAMASPTATPAGIGACMKLKLETPTATCT